MKISRTNNIVLFCLHDNMRGIRVNLDALSPFSFFKNGYVGQHSLKDFLTEPLSYRRWNIFRNVLLGGQTWTDPITKEKRSVQEEMVKLISMELDSMNDIDDNIEAILSFFIHKNYEQLKLDSYDQAWGLFDKIYDELMVLFSKTEVYETLNKYCFVNLDDKDYKELCNGPILGIAPDKTEEDSISGFNDYFKALACFEAKKLSPELKIPGYLESQLINIAKKDSVNLPIKNDERWEEKDKVGLFSNDIVWFTRRGMYSFGTIWISELSDKEYEKSLNLLIEHPVDNIWIRAGFYGNRFLNKRLRMITYLSLSKVKNTYDRLLLSTCCADLLSEEETKNLFSDILKRESGGCFLSYYYLDCMIENDKIENLDDNEFMGHLIDVAENSIHENEKYNSFLNILFLYERFCNKKRKYFMSKKNYERLDSIADQKFFRNQPRCKDLIYRWRSQ